MVSQNCCWKLGMLGDERKQDRSCSQICFAWRSSIKYIIKDPSKIRISMLCLLQSNDHPYIYYYSGNSLADNERFQKAFTYFLFFDTFIAIISSLFSFQFHNFQIVKPIIIYRCGYMNRKNQENQAGNEQSAPQTIIPKFAANWTSIVRLDRIVMNISDCQYEVVPKVGKELKWKIKTDQNNAEWDVWWTDWAVAPEVLMKMEHHQKINHFPGMYTLSRKNLLAKNLMKMRKRNPDEYNYFPLTWNLPGDYLDFKSYFETKPKGKARTYIVKPECLSQGKGIFLTRKLDDINPQQHCVVQRYLSKPYLIQGLKFDLRIYVLLAGVDPLRMFIFREGLGRFATQTYVAPNKDNMQDVCMHLTNYAINKQNQKFIFNQDENDMGIGHKRSLEAVFKVMAQKGVNVDELKLKIQDIIVKTVISGLSHLKFQYRSTQPENYRGDMCFELLGFDVIITDDLQPIILEINYTPSFSTDTPLDWNIKKNLIKDALVLMGVTKEFKQVTVKARKECRDLRMMTGKKNKLTPQQKQERRKEAVRERDAYIAQNLGGFTQIYPLPSENPRQTVYEELIRAQAEISGVIQPKKPKLPEQTAIVRRNTQKISKLPVIAPKQNIDAKQSVRRTSKKPRLKSSNKIQTQDEISKQSENEQPSRTSGPHEHEYSQKFIRARVRDISTKKRGPIRETLIPKTIQFEGNFPHTFSQIPKGNFRQE